MGFFTESALCLVYLSKSQSKEDHNYTSLLQLLILLAFQVLISSCLGLYMCGCHRVVVTASIVVRRESLSVGHGGSGGLKNTREDTLIVQAIGALRIRPVGGCSLYSIAPKSGGYNERVSDLAGERLVLS
jgi:hypothetical protein